MTRRLAAASTSAMGVALAAFSVTAPAAAQQQSQVLAVQKLTDNVYWVSGGGGNSGVVIGTSGVIVIDAKTTPATAGTGDGTSSE